MNAMWLKIRVGLGLVAVAGVCWAADLARPLDPGAERVGGRPRLTQPPSGPLTSLHLEELTWSEVAAALDRGYDTVLIPTGGTEQNGPHLPLGKHNMIVRYTAQQIAGRMGRSLVAPVLAYVPEDEHLDYPGTVSLPDDVFRAVLRAAATSYAGQGFRNIVFLGDSGGNQAGQAAVAAELSQQWQAAGVRVLHLDRYYAGHGQSAWLEGQGFTSRQIGSHAGMMDTAEILAIAPDLVRIDAPGMNDPVAGHDGAPELATAAMGRHLLEMKIQAAVEQIETQFGLIKTEGPGRDSPTSTHPGPTQSRLE